MNRAGLAAAAAAPLLTLAPPGAAPAQTMLIEGRWQSTRGLMTFNQEHMSVTGAYTRPEGVFDGQVRGRQMTGVWRQPTAERRCRRKLGGTFYWGRMNLTFTDPDQFTGRWSYCDRPTVPGDGVWSGSRINGQRPDPGG